MNDQVAVLGCGPAGLLAAHAVVLAGHDPVIFSTEIKKSYISGAQYLHTPIPWLTEAESDGELEFRKFGTRGGYALKVYDDPSAACSWDAFEAGCRPVWSMRQMYDKLWETFEPSIAPVDVDPVELEEIAKHFPLVISTIPAPSLCRQIGKHQFMSRKVWIAEGLPTPWPVADEESADNFIVYNGLPSTQWYRASKIFGHASTEYGAYPLWLKDSDSLRNGIKPLHHNCDCPPANVVHAGRFGTWTKGVLVHDAFLSAIGAVSDHFGLEAHA